MDKSKVHNIYLNSNKNKHVRLSTSFTQLHAWKRREKRMKDINKKGAPE